MPQVVNSENLIEHITTGKVPEFKAPEAPKPEIKPSDPVVDVKAEPVKAEPTKEDKPRGDDGKFVKADESAVDAKKPAEDEDVILTRKIEKIIAKKHRAQKEAEEFGAGEARKAIAAEQRAADLQRQIDELRGTKSEGAKPGEPKPEDFKTVGEYTRALVKFEATQAGKANAQNAEVSRQQAEANQLISGFVERQEAFKKATPDYEEILEAADFEIPHVSQQYLIESEMGPHLAYHLAKNPDVAASLRKLSPRRQLAELGKLEAKLEAPAPVVTTNGSTPKNDVSKAPAPIQPLDAKSTPVNKDPKDMSFSELRAFRAAEAKAKRA